ncbi:MAG: tetratricopeptide repeat protein [Bacteroidota bacterium]
MSDLSLSEELTAAPEPGAPAPKRQGRSIFADPIVRGLAIFAVVLVVLYLVAILSALLMGLMNPTQPRTSVERDIAIYEQEAMATPQDTGVWRKYIVALIQNGQYGKAQQVIDQAKKAIDQKSTQDIATAQVQLDFERKQYDKVVKESDQVRKDLKTWYDRQKKEKGSPAAMGEPISFNYSAVLLLKAEALVKLNRPKDAIKALNDYLKDNKTDSAVLVRRGQLRADNGDKQGGIADLKQALKYIPGDKETLDELKKIGAK